MCDNHSTTRAILLTGWDSNPRWNNFTRLTVWTVRPTTATRQYLPHFTGLTDRLPYGSGGFPLFRDSVVLVGIEPTTPWASTKCSTPELQYQVMIMLEGRLAPILNCLPKFYGAPADGLNFLDPRKVSTPFLLEKLIIIVGSSGLEPLP